jgi:predicted PurR-regulated permease PerM
MAGGGEEIWTTVLASARIGGSTLLGWAATLILIPVVLFYLLLDWHRLLGKIGNAVPRRFVLRTVSAGHEVNVLLAQYLRGQLLVMLTMAVFYSVGLTLFGLDLALPIGVFTGLAMFVPYLGFGIGLALALLAGLLQFASAKAFVMVAVVYGLGQIVEGFYFTPRLVGERIGLHPLAVIFALLAFAQLFGFVGVLVALPASAVLLVAIRRVRSGYMGSRLYKSG